MQYPSRGYMIVVDVDGKHSVLRLEPMNLRLNQIMKIMINYAKTINYSITFTFQRFKNMSTISF